MPFSAWGDNNKEHHYRLQPIGRTLERRKNTCTFTPVFSFDLEELRYFDSLVEEKKTKNKPLAELLSEAKSVNEKL